jgi:hypothetical protein
MKKQGLIAGFALAAAMALSPYGISAASANGLVIGDKATDGTIYAGISPDTNQPLYTTPADAPGTDTLSGAKRYCSALQTSGHQDWRAPTKNELNTLYQNRDVSELKGTFNETGSHSAGWYWSSSSPAGSDDGSYWGWAQRFSDGFQYVCPASVGNGESARPLR